VRNIEASTSMGISPANSRKPLTQRPGGIRLRHGPFAASFILAALFYVTWLSLFTAGYSVNDDMKIIPLVVGYPTGQPVPFMIFSNVLLGFLLIGLYRLPTLLNWEVLLFVAVQFTSVWLLLDQLLSSKLKPAAMSFGAAVILLCGAYFALSITYTTTAAFAAIAGCCGLFYWAIRRSSWMSRQLVIGAALILSGMLIRWMAVPLMVLLAAPCILLLANEPGRRRLAVAALAVAVLAAGTWAANRLYVRASPAWNEYYHYQSTNGLLQDTYRRENLGREVGRLAWSANDLELFYRWYYADVRTYSVDRLQFLVDRVSPLSANPGITLLSLLREPFAPFLLPYLLAALASWLVIVGNGLRKMAGLPVMLVWSVCLGINIYLSLAWKIADRVFLPTFSAAALLTFMIPFWIAAGGWARPAPGGPAAGRRRWPLYGAMTALGLAIMVTLALAQQTAVTHRSKQALYRQVLEDVEDLVRKRTISKDALIISPAHGLPLSWADPWTVRLPRVDYLDIGWLAFSPFYEDALSKHDIDDLPAALYQRQDVYLMTRDNILPYVARSFEEHQGVRVDFSSIYEMPNPARYPGFEDVHLYQVLPLD
jgi:hypothetical protein